MISNHSNTSLTRPYSVNLYNSDRNCDSKGCAVKPRFWNTFALKILLKKRFFAADQNFEILHKSPRFWNTFSGMPKSEFYCTVKSLIEDSFE